jgi:ketol-acid reductoisomerase
MLLLVYALILLRWIKAKNAGLVVKEVAEAVAGADVVMILTPDEFQAALYKDEIEPNIKQGAVLAFAHGFRFCLIKLCQEKI